MKKIFLIFITSIISVLLFESCSITNAEKTESDATMTITAKFMDGGSLEGEATLTFEKEDGNTITFFRDYLNPEEPKLKYDFLKQEGIGGNKELIGSTFIIRYIEKANGGATGMTEDGEPCNQILSIEKK